MLGSYFILFFSTVLIKEVICGVSISFCPPSETGHFPYPGDCTKYIKCNNGQTTISSCGSGGIFNSNFQQCDYAQTINHCQDVKTEDLRNLRIFCPKYSSDSFPHPFNCKKYIACSYGITHIMNCAPGTVYNPSNSVCDWLRNVPGCFGTFGNGITLREDVTLSSLNSENGNFNFETKNYIENEYKYHQSIKNAHEFEDNQNQQFNKNEHQSEDEQHHLQSIQSENNFGNEKPYYQPKDQPNYSTSNKYADQSQQSDYQNDSNSYQVMSVNKPYDPNVNILTYNDPQKIRFPTEKANNEEDLGLDIRTEDDKTKSKNSKAINSVLSIDRILEINNLVEADRYSRDTMQPTNTENKIDHLQSRNSSIFNKLYNNYHGVNKSSEYENNSDLFSGTHGRIVNSPNNWFNGKPLEPVDNHIIENRIKEDVNTIQLTPFKERIDPVASSTNEISADKIIVENLPSVNLINYNYIEDHANGSVQIDQDYSRIRNQTKNFRINSEVKEHQTILKLNHKSLGIRKIFSDNFTANASMSTFFIVPLKSKNESQHVEITNQLSGQILRLRGGSGSHHGYVEVRGIGLVGECDNNWNLEKAHKVCKKLGYKRGAEITWKGQTNDAELPLSSLETDIFCQNNAAKFQICAFEKDSKCSIERDTVGVKCFLDSAYCSKNEIPFHRYCYHLVNSSLDLNHEDAIQYCSSINSSLLYITAQDENDFISEWLTQKYPQIESVMTAGIGFTTLAKTIWVWQDSGKSFFNFMKWWPGWKNERKLPPSAKSRTSCVIMKNKFPCYNQPNLSCKTDGYFFWDVEDCATTMEGNYYICKRPYNNIIL